MSKNKAQIIDFDEVESNYRKKQIHALIDEHIEVEFYDFGYGLVPAHRHSNGGGIIADTASVDRHCYVAPDCLISGKVIVKGNVFILDGTSLEENVVINGEGKGVIIDDNSCIAGDISISGSYNFRDAHVSGKHKFSNTGKRSIKHFKLFRF